MLSSFLLAVVVDITELAREGALSDLLYADDLVLMSKTNKGCRNKFIKWKEALESKGLRLTLGKRSEWSAVASQRMACLKAKSAA